MPADPRPVLILGGTAEARALAAALVGRGTPVVTSLAGATTKPLVIEGEVRVGGFGGVKGLLVYLHEADPRVLIDATHPFAARITAAAIEAAARVGVPYLRLERSAWIAAPGDRWHVAPDLAAVLELLPSLGRRVLVALGSRLVAQLPADAGFVWLVRSIERPARLPAGAQWIDWRPPFTVERERALLEELEVEVLVARDSGGAGMAKLLAARELDLPVVLLARPPTPEGVATVATAAEALTWLDTGRHRAVTGPG